MNQHRIGSTAPDEMIEVQVIDKVITSITEPVHVLFTPHYAHKV